MWTIDKTGQPFCRADIVSVTVQVLNMLSVVILNWFESLVPFQRHHHYRKPVYSRYVDINSCHRLPSSVSNVLYLCIQLSYVSSFVHSRFGITNEIKFSSKKLSGCFFSKKKKIQLCICIRSFVTFSSSADWRVREDIFQCIIEEEEDGTAIHLHGKEFVIYIASLSPCSALSVFGWFNIAMEIVESMWQSNVYSGWNKYSKRITLYEMRQQAKLCALTVAKKGWKIGRIHRKWNFAKRKN